MGRKKPEKKDNLAEALATASAIGFTLISTLIVGVLLGRLADREFGLTPWGTLAGIVLGTVAGFWSIYKKITKGT